MGRSYNLNGHTPVRSFENVNSMACDACPTSLNVSTIGGETPTIWQYNQTPGCANDLDAATSLPS
jgi:hypothetical protein